MNDSEQLIEFLRRVYLKLLDSAQTILFVISFFLIIYMFVARPHEVSGNSMYPTFKNHEILLSSLLDVNLHTLKRGDVIVFQSPVENDKLYIKRIIGMTGDSIKLENGWVYLNGNRLDESGYLQKNVMTYGGSFLSEDKQVVIPPNSYFVMGDNRPFSSDSRQWGFLDYKKIVGRSIVRVLPVQTFTYIQRNPYKN